MSQSDDAPRSIGRLIERFIVEHLTRAASLLSNSGGVDATAVHEVRKSIKRIRAALTLIRDDLGDRFDDWNRRLRAVNRRLSSTRDLDACRQTVEKLITTTSDESRTVLERLQSELATERTQSAGPNVEQSRTSLVDVLDAVRWEFADWRPETTGFGLIRPALQKMMRKGRKLIRRLKDKMNSERVHELRKTVKLRLYWMEILDPIWSEKERTEQHQVDDLAERLGHHHDLAVLQERLRSSAVARDAAAARGVKDVADELRRRGKKLETRALKRACKLFAERPKEFSRRWRVAAEAWQAAETQSLPLEESADAESALPGHPR